MDETPFAPHNSIQRMGEWGGIVQYGGGDSSMVVMFYVHPIHNKAKSTQEGRPVFEDKIYVRIAPPGERLNIVEREATNADKQRWPNQWHLFQQNMPQVTDGTPVAMLFPAQPSIAAALQASGVHTVEQLSELSANAIENIGMGCQSWVNEATKYLKMANRGVKYNEMKAIIDERDRENNSLKHKIQLLEDEIARLNEHAEKAVTMDQVQQLLANQGGGGRRGVYTPKSNFDPQADQIAATHPTRDLARGRVGKKAAPAAPARRQRARINE